MMQKSMTSYNNLRGIVKESRPETRHKAYLGNKQIPRNFSNICRYGEETLQLSLIYQTCLRQCYKGRNVGWFHQHNKHYNLLMKIICTQHKYTSEKLLGDSIFHTKNIVDFDISVN